MPGNGEARKKEDSETALIERQRIRENRMLQEENKNKQKTDKCDQSKCIF